MATIAENIQTLRSIKSDIKNAITDKGGSVGNDFKTYAQAITNLSSGGGGGGGTEIEDGLVMRTLSEYYNDRVSVVGDFAFYNYSYSLKSVDLPKCKSVGKDAFYNCNSLIYVNLPICSYIGTDTFYNCKLLSYIDLPLCLSINRYAFYSCPNLAYAKLPKCGFIGYEAFHSCSNLKEIYLNSVTSVTILNNTFSNYPNLTSVYVPASLVDAFKTANYWSDISNKIVAYTEP